MKHARQVIRRVQVTEKGTALTERANKYVFEVDRLANKLEKKRFAVSFLLLPLDTSDRAFRLQASKSVGQKMPNR